MVEENCDDFYYFRGRNHDLVCVLWEIIAHVWTVFSYFWGSNDTEMSGRYHFYVQLSFY